MRAAFECLQRKQVVSCFYDLRLLFVFIRVRQGIYMMQSQNPVNSLRTGGVLEHLVGQSALRLSSCWGTRRL